MSPEEELGYILTADAVVYLRQIGTQHVTLNKKTRRHGRTGIFNAVSKMSIFVKDTGVFIPANKPIRIKRILRPVSRQENAVNIVLEWHTVEVEL